MKRWQKEAREADFSKVINGHHYDKLRLFYLGGMVTLTIVLDMVLRASLHQLAPFRLFG